MRVMGLMAWGGGGESGLEAPLSLFDEFADFGDFFFGEVLIRGV